MPDFWKSDWQGWLQGAPGSQPGTNANQGLGWMSQTFGDYFSGGPRYQGQIDSLIGTLGDYYGSQYSKMPEMIETQKQNLINSIYGAAPRMNELYQPILEQMSSRGILDSSVTSDAISKTNQGVQQDILSKIFDASTWAGNQQLDVTRNAPGVMSGILGAIQGASGQNAQFGQQALGAGVSYQNLVNNLMELFRTQQSRSQSQQQSQNQSQQNSESWR
jgi:hypothetical protein